MFREFFCDGTRPERSRALGRFGGLARVPHLGGDFHIGAGTLILIMDNIMDNIMG